jgi:hypothetical protein
VDKSQLVQLLQAILANDQVRLILILVAADVLLGISASIKTKSFQLCRLGDFLGNKIIPYLLGYAAVRAVVTVMPDWESYGTGVWLIIVVALLGDVAGNLDAIGFPLPPAFQKPDSPNRIPF